MNEGLEIIIRVVTIGVGATVLMDVWAALLKHLFNVSSLDYRLVGRWVGYFPRGRFRHDSILEAPPVPGERLIGWGTHYVIGILWAVLLIAIWGLEWARSPTLPPALTVGLVTLAAPFLIMQPGMGVGIAASKTPHPNVARLKSVGAHAIYGVGLYAAALVSARFIQP